MWDFRFGMRGLLIIPVLYLLSPVSDVLHPLSSEILPFLLRKELIVEQSLIKLTGVVIKKPWTMSAESWMAGGSDYFVLDVGDIKVEQRSAAEGVILRPSNQISLSYFDRYVNQFVEVEGEYVQAVPYTPQSPYENYPTDLEGKPLPRGAGFKVYSIQVINMSTENANPNRKD